MFYVLYILSFDFQLTRTSMVVKMYLFVARDSLPVGNRKQL